MTTSAAGASERLTDDTTSRPSRASRGVNRNAAFAVLTVAIVLAGAFVRALPIPAGLPYSRYVDEFAVVRPVTNMIAKHTWEPGAYDYPPLTMYATAFVAAVLHLLPGGGSVVAGARATMRDPIRANIHSADLFIAGRIAALLFASGTVALCALLGLRVSGRRAGVIAALFAATTPALVNRSSIVIVDTPATFFATASMLCASLVQSRRRMVLWAALAGLAAGFATASKYPVGVVIIVAFTVIAFGTECSRRDRVKALVASALAFVGAALAGAPTLIFDTREVREGIRHDSTFYDTKTTTYWHELTHAREVGWLLVVLAVAGLVVLVRGRRHRAFAIGYVIFATVLVASFARYPFQPFRNVLSVVPFLSVAAAVAIVAMVDALSRKVRLRPVTAYCLLGAATVVVCVSMATSGWSQYRQQLDATDSRIETREWVARNVPPGSRVLVAQELAFLPSELARFHATTVVRSIATVPPVDAARFDFVVVGDRPSTRPWLGVVADRRMVARFGFGQTYLSPRSYRQPGQLVRVFAPSGTSDPKKCFPFCG